MDNYEIWYKMKNNSLTFPDFSTKFLLFPDYTLKMITILPDFPVCINPIYVLISKEYPEINVFV